MNLRRGRGGGPKSRKFCGRGRPLCMVPWINECLFKEMPHVTTGNHRMTNIKIGNGDYVQGIRRTEADPSGQSGIPDFSSPPAHKPLRYTPGKGANPDIA